MSSIDDLYKEKPKGLIYHYTTQKGLMGIIKNKCIWATDIRYLNDTTEFTYAIKLCSDLLKDLEKERSEEIEYDYIIGLLLAKLVTLEFPLKLFHVYVCSFSEKEDVLSQWRAYSRPSINGFSIGFDYKDLIGPMESCGARLCKCIYKKDEQESWLKKIINEAIDKFNSIKIVKKFESSIIWVNSWLGNQKVSEFPKDPSSNEIRKLMEDFDHDLLKVAPVLKDPSFHEEKEWRIVLDLFSKKEEISKEEINKISYREGRSVIIPYKEFYLTEKDEKLVIPEIVIGPTPHKELSKDSLFRFLNSEQVEYIRDKIRFSEIPYRGET